MSARALFAAAVATFLLGLLVGGLGVAVYYSFFSRRAMEITLAADASTTVIILERIREGGATNAIESLESKVDSDLLTIAILSKDTIDVKRNSQLFKSLALIKGYRAAYPHKSEHPDIDEKIAKVLTLW